MRLTLAGSLLILLFFAVPGMAEPINLAISPLGPAGSPKVLAAEYLGKLLEERSSSRLHVSIIEETDSNQADIQKKLENQQIQMALPEISNLGEQLPLLNIYEFPFLFQDRPHLHQAIDSETGQKILRMSQQTGLKPLVVWDGSTRQLLANDTLTTVSNIQQEFITALQSNASISNSNKSRWLESTLSDANRQAEQFELNTLTLTNHGFSCCVLLTHQDFWDSLPDDLKVIITGAVNDATRYLRELAEQLDKETLESLRKDNRIKVQTLPVAQRMKWHKTMLGHYKKSMDRTKLEIVDNIIKH